MTRTTIQVWTSQPTISEGSTVSSPKRLARLDRALFYRALGILGGFAFAGVDSAAIYVALYTVPTTASNLVANVPHESRTWRPGLLHPGRRSGFFPSLTLYTLLRHVECLCRPSHGRPGRYCARSIKPPNILFEFQGMRVATDPAYLAAVCTAGSTALAMPTLDLQHFGYAIAVSSSDYGSCRPGYLAFKYLDAPKVLGIVLVVGVIGYLFDMLGDVRRARGLRRSSTRWRHCSAWSPRSPLLAYLLIKGRAESSSEWLSSAASAIAPASVLLCRRSEPTPSPSSRQRFAVATVPRLHRPPHASAHHRKESIPR